MEPTFRNALRPFHGLLTLLRLLFLGAMGTAFVELRDAAEKPLPGFTLADCEEIGGNFIDQRVYWKSWTDISALSGKPVRLHFKFARTKLYGFQFLTE